MNESVPKQNLFEGGENQGNVPPAYLGLLEKIQENPHSDEAWQNAIALAKEEEAHGGGSESYYSNIPLDELITLGERLKTARLREKDWPPDAEVREGQYSVLAERASTGEYWYDIILGHVNDKMFEPVNSRLERLVESRAEKGKFETGLDLGSGFGNTLQTIAPHFEKVTGVEQLPQLVEVAKNNPSLPENVKILCASALNLKLPDESFDVVVSNGLTHYLRLHQVRTYAHEISKVLKDGGRYLEAYIVKQPNNPLPVIEKEYLTSAKALLVNLIDNIFSKFDDEYPTWGSGDKPWDLSEMSSAFQDNGVYLRRSVDSERENNASIKNTGVGVLEFIKDKKLKAESSKGGYSSGS